MQIVYTAGVYASQAQRIVDNSIQAIRDAGYLKRFNVDRNNPVIEECDIYFCHSSKSLPFMKEVKEKYPNAKIVLQRDSAHTARFYSLLSEEDWLTGAANSSYGSPIEEMRAGDWHQMEEYDLADGIILASDFEVESFIEMGVPRRKLHKVPFTVNAEVYKPLQDLDNKPIDTNPFTIVYCGGDRFRKGHRYIAAAVEGLKSQGLELRLIDQIPHAQINNIYWNAHMFAMPTIEDGNPVATLEALSCGLPTLVSKYTGTKDLIENMGNGFIVYPRDIEAIQNAINYLYHNRKAIIRLGKNARDTILKWQWPDYQKRLVETLEKINGL